MPRRAQAIPYDIAAVAKLLRKIESFAENTAREGDTRDEYQTAFIAVDIALRQTVSYLEMRRNGARKNRSRERLLARLWSEASNAAAPVDSELARNCLIKGQGWLDPKVLSSHRYRNLRISVDDMRDALINLNKSRQGRTKLPSWFPIAGMLFAAATFVTLVYFLVGPQIEERKNVFDVWVALCVSASAAFLGGTAAARGNIPIFKDSPIQISAVGGIGIFIVVYLILHTT